MTAPPDLDAIEALVGELDDAAYDHGEKILGDSRAFTGAKQGRGAARAALLAAIRIALTARDERIAALESRCAFFRSLVNVRGGDEAIEQIAARVGADLARRAAEWERTADEVAAVNVEASARIAALESGLREACDLAKQASFYAHGDIGAEYREHVDRLRALADGKP